jgi:hypothetical protein
MRRRQSKIIRNGAGAISGNQGSPLHQHPSKIQVHRSKAITVMLPVDHDPIMKRGRIRMTMTSRTVSR